MEREILKFFPYGKFRPYQKEAILFAYRIISKGIVGLLNSPCGTGKSVSVLTAFFIAKSNHSAGKLFVLTRTRSQLEIFCRELKGIKQHSGKNFVASILTSKQEICPKAKDDERLKKLSYHDFIRYCKDIKEMKLNGGCEYYTNTIERWRLTSRAQYALLRLKVISPLLPDELYNFCKEFKLCPHEVSKALMPYSEVVVGNYNYILSEAIRESIISKAKIKIEGIDCVFDEAHSLPDYATGMFSDELSTITVDRALKEAEEFRIDDYGFIEALDHVVRKLGLEAKHHHKFDEEHLIEKDRVIMEIRKLTGLNDVSDLCEKLILIGESVRLSKLEKGGRPTSYIGRCAEFVYSWINANNKSHVFYSLAVKNGDKEDMYRIGFKCMDPSIAGNIINQLRSTILMSGTLWEFQYYIDVLGIRKTYEALNLPSPFPRENRLILVDRTVTTKYEKRSLEEYYKIAEHLKEITKNIPGRIAIYFPSYEVANNIIRSMNTNIPILKEEKDTNIVEVLEFLKSKDRCIITGVARGKISEGVDMTEEGRSLLLGVIVVGLPYPKKTEIHEALRAFYKTKFGENAVKYSDEIPCINALAQSIGRLIRSQEDKGIIVLMDRRVSGRFKSKLPEDIRKDIKGFKKFKNLIETLRKFTATF
ncbi:MAG: ATP-dependent DNA helicase [Candidatus Methanomethylicia archaeon]